MTFDEADIEGFEVSLEAAESDSDDPMVTVQDNVHSAHRERAEEQHEDRAVSDDASPSLQTAERPNGLEAASVDRTPQGSSADSAAPPTAGPTDLGDTDSIFTREQIHGKSQSPGAQYEGQVFNY